MDRWNGPVGPERDAPIQYKIDFCVDQSQAKNLTPYLSLLHIAHRRTVSQEATLFKQGQTSGRPKRKPSEGLGWAAWVSH